MSVSEAPGNWLSKKIEAIRKEVKGLFEMRRERNQIIDAIHADTRGAQLAKKPDLKDAVMAGLAVANAVDRAQRRKQEMTASAAIQASWAIFEELGEPVPEPEF